MAPSPQDDRDPAARIARDLLDGFETYLEAFLGITRRAHWRFDSRDWHGAQSDSLERLDLYPRSIDETVGRVLPGLGGEAGRVESWMRTKEWYAVLIAGREDLELAETHFNSVARRFFPESFVERDLGFTVPGPGTIPRRPSAPPFTTHAIHRLDHEWIADRLARHRFETPFENLARDAVFVAGAIASHLAREGLSRAVDAVDLLDALFYRNKSAYLVGRIRCGERTVPLVLPLLNTERGITVDAALLREDDVSIVFSFTRSYFLVDVPSPRHLILFLKSIMPIKRIAELYISIGHNRHGKTELYRDFATHLESSTDRLEIARGERGLVMIVFTLPSYDIVFKVIRDVIPPPKTIERRTVLEKYNLVFRHDRAGRLVDAQEFEHWTFARERFSEELLRELRIHAGETVRVDGDTVVVSHLYTERRLTPLDLFLREAPEAAARDAVVEYGQTVKDLAATNIFPGDLLLKNFGVTRHGRVVFYDYDELCLLADCNFRSLPDPRTHEEETLGEPWFYVAPNDLFPEEFIHFLGLRGGLRDEFLASHGDLLGVSFWAGMQRRHREGEILDIFPYRPEHRFPRSSAPAAERPPKRPPKRRRRGVV